MTIAYWCVLVMILFPYVFTVLAKTGPGFNNETPRIYLEHIQGWRKKAHWVQLNSFEAISAFAAGVIIAHLSQAHQATIDKLAITFVIARVLYAICYLTNKSALRSLFFSIGLGCVIALFIVSA